MIGASTPLPPEGMGLTTTCRFFEGVRASVPDAYDMDVVLCRKKLAHKRTPPRRNVFDKERLY